MASDCLAAVLQNTVKSLIQNALYQAIKLLIIQMLLEHRLSALPQLHLHSPLNTWLQYITKRQLQDEARDIYDLAIGAPYIRDFTVGVS